MAERGRRAPDPGRSWPASPWCSSCKWATFAVIGAVVLVLPQMLVGRPHLQALDGRRSTPSSACRSWCSPAGPGRCRSARSRSSRSGRRSARRRPSTGISTCSLAFVISFVVGGVVAALVGLPALRRRGFYLAVATLAFSLATTSYFLNKRFFGWVPDGRIARPPLFGRIDITSTASFYYVVYAVLAACTVHREGHPRQPHRTSVHGPPRQRARGRGVRAARHACPPCRVRAFGRARRASPVASGRISPGPRSRPARAVPEPADLHHT